MKRGKLILVGISGLLVVGVVIGCIAGVARNNHNNNTANNNNNNNNAAPVSTTSKAVAAICAPTDYKDACIQSLSSVANNQTASPIELIKAAILYTVEEVKKALEKTAAVGGAAKDDFNKMAAEDCQELLEYAVDELQASFTMVGDPALHNETDREAELNNFLSSVISYQETCLDGFNSTELRNAMAKNLENTSKLSENALAMVTAFNDILKAFNIPVNVGSTASRRLLGEDGYPTWMSGVDRKLLGKQGGGPRPNAVVAKDGSGQFKSIAAALKAYPKNLRGRYVIYVKAGIYDEYITVEKNQVNVLMYGDGPTRTIVTGKKSNAGGVPTFRTASFSAIGEGFIAKNMGFRNTAGPQGHQAVALRVQSDRSAFFNCRFEGYQDTLYAQQHRTLFRDCFVSGTVDFIFGMGSTVIQNSEIHVRRPMANQQNTVTAHGRKTARENTGLVIQNCRFTKEPQTNPTYLGRPWKEYSRAVIMESDLGNNFHPAGWLPWAGDFALNTLYFAEYANRNSNMARRVNWKGFHNVHNRNEVVKFTAGPFLSGNQWIPATGGPFYLGMAH